MRVFLDGQATTNGKRPSTQPKTATFGAQIAESEPTVVIIGSGAGGGTVAHELTRRGVPCVLLEAGPYLTGEDYENDEWAAFSQMAWLDMRTTSGSWRVSQNFPNLPAWIVKAVGGTTTHWAGATPRFMRHEFAAGSRLRRHRRRQPARLAADAGGDGALVRPGRDRDGVDPPPRPCAAAGEQQLQGVRQRGGTGGLPVLRDRSVCDQCRAVRRTPGLGPGRLQLPGRQERGQVVDPGARGPPGPGQRPLRAAANCHASRITHDASGKADGVEYLDADGNLHRQAARVVCLAGNSIESPRLLLLSASSQFPDGLANSSGQVGRNYMRHMTGSAYAQFEQPVRMYRGETMAGIIADEAKHDTSRGFAGGYYMETLSLGVPFYASFVEPGSWGRDFTELMDGYERTAGMWIVGEDMPQESNRITLHADIKDGNGLPVPNVHFDDHPNDVAMREHGYAAADRIYSSVGALSVHHTPPYPSTHNLGTCRMSERPDDGVVDRWGRAHDVPNLFVSDGSVMTTGGAANPTLTIVALAMRQADHIADGAEGGVAVGLGRSAQIRCSAASAAPRRWAGAVPNDEHRRLDERSFGGLALGDEVQKASDGLPAEVEEIQPNGGQRRLEEPGLRNVVEPHDAHALRNFETELVGGFQQTE